MNFYTLSIHASGHDASYALFNHSKLIQFSSGERATRIKYDPKMSLDCFDNIYDNITKTIDLLVIYPKGDENHQQTLIEHLTKKFKCAKVIYKEIAEKLISRNIVTKRKQQKFTHHVSHALSAFYMSQFEEAICLIIDGYGHNFLLLNDKFSGISAVETTSIIKIDKNYQREILYKRFQYYPIKRNPNSGLLKFSYDAGLPNLQQITKQCLYDCKISSHIDIGNMYLTISKHLGFGYNGSGKVMGLSAYGNSQNDLPEFLIGETEYSNNNLFTIDNFINSSLYSNLYDELSFQEKADMAYEVQKSLEKVFISRAEFIKKNSQIRNLVIGGGCALNILGVSLIKEKFPEFNIFVDPIATDATQSIGLGLYAYIHYYSNGMLKKKPEFDSIYLGPQYQDQEIENRIDDFIGTR